MTQEKKKDLRVQKTEKALVAALFELLAEKPFEDITVSDLCGKAMIRRATFYKHYEDKYQFLDDCLQKKQRLFAKAHPADGSCDTMEQYTTVLHDILRYFRDNQMLVDEAMKHPYASGVTAIFTKHLMRDIHGKVEALKAKGKAPDVPADILASFFTGALLGVARWWHMSGTNITEDELVCHIQMILTALTPMLFEYKEGENERQPAQE